jgi:hypothetical protein
MDTESRGGWAAAAGLVPVLRSSESWLDFVSDTLRILRRNERYCRVLWLRAIFKDIEESAGVIIALRARGRRVKGRHRRRAQRARS